MPKFKVLMKKSLPSVCGISCFKTDESRKKMFDKLKLIFSGSMERCVHGQNHNENVTNENYQVSLGVEMCPQPH